MVNPLSEADVGFRRSLVLDLTTSTTLGIIGVARFRRRHVHNYLGFAYE